MSGVDAMIEKDPVKPFEAPDEATLEADSPNPQGMTSEELDTFLAGEPVESQPAPEGEDENEEGEPTPGEDPPAGAEGDPTDDPDDSDTISREELDAVMTENARLLKKAENQDKFFDRMGTEVGILRKNTPEDEKAELERIREIYYEDPVEGHKALTEYHEGKNRAVTAQNEYQTNQLIDANRESLATLIPDLPGNQAEVVNEIAALMAEDNAAPEAIEAFKNQPYRMDQSTLYNLYHRNMAVKTIKERDTTITDLKSQIEELKGRPDKLLSNIEKATRTQTMSGKSGGAVPSDAANSSGQKPATKMSRAELEEILKG